MMKNSGVCGDVCVSVCEGFEGWLRGTGRNERTVRAYLADVRSFALWFEGENREGFEVGKVTSFDLLGYRRWSIEEERVSPATWNRRRASLLVLVRWARDEGVLAYDPAADLKGQAEVDQAPRWLSKEEYGRFMRQVERLANGVRSEAGRRQALRDQAVVALMVWAGLREGEVCELRREDVQVSERKGKVVVRHGKGEKYREVPLNEKARRAVKGWLDVCTQTGPLFIGKQGERLQARGVQRRVAEIGRLAGVDVTPHQLRHTFAKRLLDKGGQLTEVKDLMGHSRLETTARYVKPGWEDLEYAVERI